MLLSSLPSPRDYRFFIAIDPGFSGSVALMNASGTTLKVFDMPVKEMGDSKKYRGLDLDALSVLFRDLARYPKTVCGLENPTTRPGEGAERCFRFGRQLGVLETFLHHGFDYYLISPMLWKSRLGLDGKEKDPGSEQGIRLFESEYGDFRRLIRGPKGGLKDGRLDALLMCHFLRTREPVAGLRTMTRGEYTPEMMAIIFARGKRVKKRLIGP